MECSLGNGNFIDSDMIFRNSNYSTSYLWCLCCFLEKWCLKGFPTTYVCFPTHFLIQMLMCKTKNSNNLGLCNKSFYCKINSLGLQAPQTSLIIYYKAPQYHGSLIKQNFFLRTCFWAWRKNRVLKFKIW